MGRFIHFFSRNEVKFHFSGTVSDLNMLLRISSHIIFSSLAPCFKLFSLAYSAIAFSTSEMRQKSTSIIVCNAGETMYFISSRRRVVVTPYWPLHTGDGRPVLSRFLDSYSTCNRTQVCEGISASAYAVNVAFENLCLRGFRVLLIFPSIRLPECVVRLCFFVSSLIECTVLSLWFGLLLDFSILCSGCRNSGGCCTLLCSLFALASFLHVNSFLNRSGRYVRSCNAHHP